MRYKIQTFGFKWSGKIGLLVADTKLHELDNTNGDANFTVNVDCEKNERLRLVLADVQSVKDLVIEVSVDG